MSKLIYDVAIVGAGPAGITAAIDLARRSHSVVLLAPSFEGQLWQAGKIDNWPGEPGIKGRELVIKLQTYLSVWSNKVTLQIGELVNKVIPNNPKATFALLTDNTTYQAQTVLLAPGVKRQRLGVAGEKRLNGAGISYCATCDAPFLVKRQAAVISKDGSGLIAALEVSKFASKVWLLETQAKLNAALPLQKQLARAANIKVLDGSLVTEILGHGQVEGIRYRQGSQESKGLAVDAVVVQIGTTPNTQMVAGVVELDDAGYIVVDPSQATSCKGIFAAGDATNRSAKQLATAAGDGLQAAAAIHSIIIERGE